MAESSDVPKFVSKETFFRLVKDVKDLNTNPLHSHGIYYHHLDDNILYGKALIIGPTDTPYSNGYYLFGLVFPENYPHSPPEITYYTNDGCTRFHPNLYATGKVCLSILNTWPGEQWTACQTIASVLLTLCSILTNNPLMHEPGIADANIDCENYNIIINYKTYEVAILLMLTSPMIKNLFECFMDIINKHFIENFSKNIKRLNELVLIYPNKVTIGTHIYCMQVSIDYNKLIEDFNNRSIRLSL